MSVKNAILEIQAQILANSDAKICQAWNNQLSNFDNEEARLYPAVYLEWSIDEWKKRSCGSRYTDDFRLIVHIVTDSYITDDFSYLDAVESVLLSLENFSGTNFGPIASDSEEMDVDHDALNEYKYGFKMQFTDDSTSFIKDKVLAPGPFTAIINEDLKIDNDLIRTGKPPLT